MKKVIKYSLLYFIYVFLIGFILGTIRVLFLVPNLGEQVSELVEIPFMIMICYLVAQYIVKLSYKNLLSIQVFQVGIFALVYLLIFEFTLVLWLRDISILEYIETKYSIAGITYLISLILYAIFPYLIYKSKKSA